MFRKPKNGAVSSPLKPDEEDIFFPIIFEMRGESEGLMIGGNGGMV